MPRHRALDLDRRLDRRGRRPEDGEELVGAGVDLEASAGAHRRALDAPHGIEHRSVSVLELGEVAARALDVGEEEGQLPGRQLRADLAVDEPDRQDAVALGRLQQLRPGAVAGRVIVEQHPVEAGQRVADVGLVVDRQAPPAGRVDVGKRAVRQLRPF